LLPVDTGSVGGRPFVNKASAVSKGLHRHVNGFLASPHCETRWRKLATSIKTVAGGKPYRSLAKKGEMGDDSIRVGLVTVVRGEASASRARWHADRGVGCRTPAVGGGSAATAPAILHYSGCSRPPARSAVPTPAPPTGRG